MSDEVLRNALNGMLNLHRVQGPLWVLEFGPGGTSEECRAQREVNSAIAVAKAALEETKEKST